MLKEQVAEILGKNYIGDDDIDASNYHHSRVTTEILNLFKAEVDKLTVIDAEGIQEFCDTYYIHYYTPYVSDILQAQLQHTKKQLLGGQIIS